MRLVLPMQGGRGQEGILQDTVREKETDIDRANGIVAREDVKSQEGQDGG